MYARKHSFDFQDNAIMLPYLNWSVEIENKILHSFPEGKKYIIFFYSKQKNPPLFVTFEHEYPELLGFSKSGDKTKTVGVVF